MKKANIIFWIATILFCAFMLFSAVSEIRNTPDAKAIMQHLGYPDYFNPFLGIMKVLGVIALLAPGFPRLKEWAYAGFFFDLLGATYSGLAVEGFKPQMAFMLVFFLVWAVSYVCSHRRLNVAR